MDLVTVNNAGITEELQQWDTDAHFSGPVVAPSTLIVAAAKSGQTILYMALQAPLVLGPFVANPTATKHDISVALKEIFVASRFAAQQKGLGWQLVFTADEQIMQFAEKQMQMERMKEAVFRRSVW